MVYVHFKNNKIFFKYKAIFVFFSHAVFINLNSSLNLLVVLLGESMQSLRIYSLSFCLTYFT